MQVGLYLKLAHELGILPVACVHSAHPVVHQRPTLHATGLCLGIEMSGRTFNKVGEILLNLLRALDMARPGKWENMSLSSACCVTMQSDQMQLSHAVRLVTAVFANYASYCGHARLFMLKLDNSEEACQYPSGGQASYAQTMMTYWHHRPAAEQARLVTGIIRAKEDSRLTLAEGGAMRLAICSSSVLVRPKSLRRLRRS